MKSVRTAVCIAVVAVLAAACGDAPAPLSERDLAPAAVLKPATGPEADAPAAVAGVRGLEWDDLVPQDFRPDDLLADYDVESMSDDDPRAQELMAKLLAMWNEAPVVEALDGQTVRLPGFVVPLEGDGRRVEEFLLVPYYGACIHVPPPPANQTVHVLAQGRDVTIRGLFDTVWVTGIMRVERKSSQLAEAGYQIEAIEVTPYN
jgi:hypothetical protein